MNIHGLSHEQKKPINTCMGKVHLLALFLCFSFAAFAQESSVAQCSDGIDNDGDGFIDCYDGNCATSSACSSSYIGKDRLCQDPPDAPVSFGMQLANQSK